MNVSASPPSSTKWPLERALFAMAGTVTLVSAALAALVSPWFLLLTAFVGVNQWAYVLLGKCPASLILKRSCGLRSSIYPEPERTTVAVGDRTSSEAVAR